MDLKYEIIIKNKLEEGRVKIERKETEDIEVPQNEIDQFENKG